MAPKAKKSRHSLAPRVTTQKKNFSHDTRVSVKKKGKEPQTKSPTVELEKQYLQTFTAFPLPYQGVYTDDDSLEQPSALKYVPTTSSPASVS